MGQLGQQQRWAADHPMTYIRDASQRSNEARKQVTEPPCLLRTLYRPVPLHFDILQFGFICQSINQSINQSLESTENSHCPVFTPSLQFYQEVLSSSFSAYLAKGFIPWFYNVTATVMCVLFEHFSGRSYFSAIPDVRGQSCKICWLWEIIGHTGLS